MFSNPVAQGQLAQIKARMASTVPQFKVLPAPIFTRDHAPWLVSGSEVLYWPCLFRARRVYPSALDEWYLYYSTDHSTGQGGVGLATAPNPRGPWADRGRIYLDTTEGSQTETPQVVWNPATSLFHLYYQQKISTSDQSTLLATSPNGVDTWTRVGKVISAITPTRTPGNGHAGYARVQRVGKKWVANHLMGGTDRCHFALSYSDDGLTWITDPRLIGYQAQRTDSRTARRLSAFQTAPFFWRGSRFAAVVSTPHTSGGVSSDKQIHLAQFRSHRDMTMLGDLLKPGDFSWATSTVHMPSVVEGDGVLYMVFLARNASNNGVFGLAEAAA